MIKKQEAISRLMDDDLSPAEKEKVVEMLLKDKDAAEIWQRWQLTRLALQNRLKDDDSVVERVRAAIAHEEVAKTRT